MREKEQLNKKWHEKKGLESTVRNLKAIILILNLKLNYFWKRA